MKKLFHTLSLLIAIGALGTLSGCELYFGGHGGSGGGNDSWNYCGSDGYYSCQGDNCTWVSATCPAGQGSGSGSGQGSGYECTMSTDCAAGCYCANGTCNEGGFCTSDSDCGTGFHCNTDRSSCEPNPTQPPGCKSDADCNVGGGQFCDVPTGTCTQGSCAGDVTCNTVAPTCASGSVPLIYNGCYTGGCLATDACSAAPVCAHINDEPNCLDRADCTAVYVGLNCTNSQTGQSCHSGDAGCTCASFSFDHCATTNANGARMVIEYKGKLLDASQLILH
jgi:hypothetical protein